MGRRRSTPGTALASTSTTLPATGKVITVSAAIDIVKKVAADELRAARRKETDKAADLAKAVGGQINRVDESVIQQAKALMTRIALITRKRSGQHTTVSGLDGVVKKLGSVIGELEAFMLTNKAMGLFEEVSSYDYTAGSWTGNKNPLAFAGKKARKAAEAALAGYAIVDDPKPGKKGEKNVTPDPSTARTLADLTADKDNLDDEDDELVDDDDEAVA